ncbi:MAG: glycosyltransferase family 4 protein [Acidimicrobiia bacterium]|nr:glycosyltransferase family 4 protein [Acidimicrobiia bacterium]
MRVALVCPYSLSVPGGVQAQVLGLADALRAQGHHVAVVGPAEGTPPSGAVGVGRSVAIPVNGSVAPMAPHPAAVLRTLRAVRPAAFDVVHLHEPLAPSITLPLLLAHPAPLVATFHAAGGRTPYRWFGTALRRLADRIDVRVAVSAPAARLVQRHLGAIDAVVGNGIAAGSYSSVEPAVAGGPTVLFLGRHERRKGLDVLLKARRHLSGDVVIWVAGDGPDSAHLRRRCAGDPRVHWLGRLDEHDKIARLRAASLLCVPSRYGESFGVVLLEAMAAGTPVVASDLPGYRDWTGGGQAAHLVPPGSPVALAEGIRAVLEDSGRRDALRAAGDRVARGFSFEVVAERYLTIYEALLAPGPPPSRHPWWVPRPASGVAPPAPGPTHRLELPVARRGSR